MSIIARGQVTIATVEDGAAGQTGAAAVYRGLFSSTAIYYNNAVRRDVVKYNDSFYIYKGTNGVRGTWKASNWEAFGGQYDSVATSLLLAEFANLGGFIFAGGRLISQKGTLNGVESTDYENPDFVPYIVLDGTNGTSQIHNGEFFGGVRTIFHYINSTNCIALGSGQYKVSDKLNLLLDESLTSYEQVTVILPNDTSFIGKTVNIHNGVFFLTKTSLRFENTIIVKTESRLGIFFKPFLGAQSDITHSNYINNTVEIEFLAGTLSFLCVPGYGDSVNWICTNYPEGSSTGGEQSGVTASATLVNGDIIVGNGGSSIKPSGFKISSVSFNEGSSYIPSGYAVKQYVTSRLSEVSTPDNVVTTEASELTSGAVLLGSGGKALAASSMSIETVNLSGGTAKLPSSYVVKSYVDGLLNEWYNIFNVKGTDGKIYTVVENISGTIINNGSKYRLVLLKFRKQGKKGRKWGMPMYNYEMYNLGRAKAPSDNAIIEADTWWPISSSNMTPWFSVTGHSLTSVLSLATRDRGASTYEWKNTRNKKMKVGVAIYKKTSRGEIGWQRCSNIAFIELYKNNSSSTSYFVNMMP
jgi:hypothetical protein